MPLNDHKNYIHKLLNKLPIDASQQELKEIPSNYEQICQTAVNKELINEYKKLSDLLNSSISEDDLKVKFKQLCADRYYQNKNTYFSYTAMPDGECNKLYWEIAKHLFTPKHLGEMISILMPDVKGVLLVDITVDESKTKKVSDNMHVKLANESLDALSKRVNLDNSKGVYPPTLQCLTECIVGNGMIFPIDQVAALPFNLQNQLRDELNKHPQLESSLYTHNDDFKKLMSDIDLINKSGKTAREMFDYFIKELTLSGTRYTGSEWATKGAGIAIGNFKTFLGYLKSSKEKAVQDFHDDLLKMKSASNVSLQDVLDHLRRGECVEEAAKKLTAIKDNANNKALLDKQNVLSASDINDIKKMYGKNPLKTDGFDASLALPDILRKEIISNVNIKSDNDFISLILNLPVDEYENLLKHAKITCKPILPNTLNEAITWVNDDQKKAFVRAVVNQADKMGDKKRIFELAKLVNDKQALDGIIKHFPKNEQLLMRASIGDVVSITNLLTEVDVKYADKNNKTAVHFAASNGHLDAVKLLIAKGADINSKCKFDETNQNLNAFLATPIDLAVDNGHHNVVEFLLDQSNDSRQEPNVWALMISTKLKEIDNLNLIKLLYEKDIFSRDNLKNIMFSAVLDSRENIVMFLLDKIDINYFEKIFHHAIHRGMLESVKYMYKHMSPEYRKKVFDTSDPLNYTPLAAAVSNGNMDMIKFILKEGGNINGKPGDNLHNLPLNIAIREGNVKVMKFLLENGADVNIVKTYRITHPNSSLYRNKEVTPLQYAVTQINAEAVKTLLEYNCKQDNKQNAFSLLYEYSDPKNVGPSLNMLKSFLGDNIDGVKVTSEMIQQIGNGNPKLGVALKLASYIQNRRREGEYTGFGKLWMTLPGSNFLAIPSREEKVNCAIGVLKALLNGEPISNIEDFTPKPAVLEKDRLGVIYEQAKRAFGSDAVVENALNRPVPMR